MCVVIEHPHYHRIYKLNRPIVYAVEESTNYRQLLQQVFTLLLPIYELRLFKDSQALLEVVVTDEQAGLMIICSQLRDMTERELTTLLRQTLTWKHVPVVVMSRADAGTVLACYKAGANSVLEKPVGLKGMSEVFQSVCNYWFNLHQPSSSVDQLAELNSVQRPFAMKTHFLGP